MTIPNVNYLHAAVLLRTLIEAGVRHAVISPGSRSTPLARVAMEIVESTCHVVLDERSAGYFALGLSKSSGAPAIVICTSGTAGANYYPAVIEAAQSFFPLIVLTADRPRRFRHTGALQTIDQDMLYGRYPRLFCDLPEPELSLEHCTELRYAAEIAYRKSLQQPPGPVHLNVPFDEPLAPIFEDEAECSEIWRRLGEPTRPPAATQHTDSDLRTDLQEIVRKLDASLCGLIVAGPNAARSDEEAAEIHALARQLGWPLLADVVSGLRFHSDPVCPYYDVFLRDESCASLAPDVVIELGACPTSKSLNQYLDRHRGSWNVRLQPHEIRQDPSDRADATVIDDTATLCRALAAQVEVSRDSLLLEPFQRAAGSMRIELSGKNTARKPLSEPECVRAATAQWPDGGNLVLASSLSIRYADMLAAGGGRQYRVSAQRGTNGIDGTLSHAAGIAAASKHPTLLIVGDLAFCHDLGGLATARHFGDRLTILLLNNNGGGIFHLLPVVEYPDLFEKIHATPHGLELAHAAQLFDLEWRRVSTTSELSAALTADDRAKLRVIEFVSERAQNLEELRQLIERLTGVLH